MAREDVEAIERFFEELNPLLLGDESLMDLANRYVEPDAVLELGSMEGGRTGPAGFESYFEGQRAVVNEMQIDPEEFIDVGDGQVVMPFHLHGTARETGLPIDFRYA
jgi:SnoaL-like domain